MRRWLCVFLLALLPLQSVWASAATYCAHEFGAHPSHFGHHDGHHHEAPANQADDEGGPSSSASVDVDATHCHGICAVMITTAVQMPPPHAEPPATPCSNADIQAPPSSPPERPQWKGHA